MFSRKNERILHIIIIKVGEFLTNPCKILKFDKHMQNIAKYTSVCEIGRNYVDFANSLGSKDTLRAIGL